MKNFVIAQIVLNIRQWLSRPCQPPARRAAGKHQLSAPAAPQTASQELPTPPPQTLCASAPCPFSTVTVAMLARSGVAPLLGCLVSDEAADERCESPVTDGASHG